MDDEDGKQPHSELPYDAWTEDALRLVAIRALEHAAREGLPGEHHFYITFRTDQPGVAIPARLLAKYPNEMTIVLQHQFWDLSVDQPGGRFSVGLSFGGISSILTIPFAALTGFADPHVRFGLRFSIATPQADDTAAPTAEVAQLPPPAPTQDAVAADEPPAAAEVVSLDKFRRRKD